MQNMSQSNRVNATAVLLIITVGLTMWLWTSYNRNATGNIEQKGDIPGRQTQDKGRQNESLDTLRDRKVHMRGKNIKSETPMGKQHDSRIDFKKGNRDIEKHSENDEAGKQKQFVERCSSVPDDSVPDALVKTYKDNRWEIDNSICQGLENKIGENDFQRVMFSSIAVGDMPIFIHDPKVDGISNKVWKTHNFEPHIFRTLLPLLKRDKETSLIDVGTHIGINSLQAAHFGRNVIAIEATNESTQHICASAREGKVESKLTIIHNAVSNEHTIAHFIRKGGFGGAFMDDGLDLRKLKVAWAGKRFDFSQYTSLETVTLDDLLDLPNICAFRKVIIKMDIEGSEHKALEGAKKFFKNVDVQGVLMEYRWHVTRSSKDIILEFFEEFKFDPYNFSSGYLRKLVPRSMKNPNVLWLPRFKSVDLENIKLWEN